MPGMLRGTRKAPGNLTGIELAAIAYLAMPVALFLVAYTRIQVWGPGAACIGFALWQCAARVGRPTAPQGPQLTLYFLAVAALTVFASGSFGLVHTNSDWIKHFAVFRFILDNDSLVGSAPGYDGETLRYYLGWYIVPGLVAKLFSTDALLLIVGTWTTLGLYLFFSVAAKLTDRRVWRYAMPVVFLLFSGADIIGTAITGFWMGPQYHMEWWAGWIEFSSNYTDIIWAPQHALPAWIGAALALRLVHNPASLIVIPLVSMATVLWSPFAGVGLVPFFLYALWCNVRHLSPAVILNGVLMLALVIVLARYMRVGADSMPFGAAWSLRCLGQGGPCYSFGAYLRFVAIEVAPALLVCQIATRWRDAMVWIASVSLLAMPFFHFGAFNDLNLHGSIPALAVISLIAWRVIAEATRWLKLAFATVMVAGPPTPAQEMRRIFSMKDGPTTEMTFSYLLQRAPELRTQYMIDKAPWIIRRPKPQMRRD
jgi:hypothetical protein